MAALLEQLQIDQTFFIQFGIVVVGFFLVSQVYLKPFLKLIEKRHEKTIENQRKAKELTEQAHAKLEEYKARLDKGREGFADSVKTLLEDAKKEEHALLTAARDEAKKISTETQTAIAKQKAEVLRSLDAEVVSLAKAVSDKVLTTKN